MVGFKSSMRFRVVQLGMVTLQAVDLHRLNMARAIRWNVRSKLAPLR